MDELEARREFQRQEDCRPSCPLCWHCGNECSGDVTETVNVDGQTAEVAVCDEPDECPENKE